ncbi:MAG: efflux RND transporter permease subunit [Candidatus Eisenbacteria bacterium]|nr:efflux RND transporter permease subunit [Candidatus Eisenbacteria bacterium]
MTRVFAALRDQRRAILAVLIAGIAAGAVLAPRMPAAILPEVTFPRIKVIAESAERPGDEMLRVVTRPLEQQLRWVPDVREMRTTTARGSTEINLDCAWGADMNLALQRVQARMDAVRADLPAGTTLEAQLMSPVLFPVVGFSLISKTRSLAELRDIAQLRIQPELARLPGVSQVVVQGGDPLEAQVTLDPAQLEGRGIDAQKVADAIERAGTLQTVGLLDANRELYLGLADARPANLDALAQVPVAVDSGPPVPVGRLGTIALAPAPRFTRYVAHGREAVLVNLLRQPKGSTIDVSRAAHRWFAEHRGLLPPDVAVETFYDQADLVRASVDSVRDSLLVGAIMAIAIVVVFLRSLRLGLSAAILLPGSIGLTVLALWFTRQSLNLMTLGGVAAAVGLVLDDAIVVVEHFDHELRGGATPATIAAAMAGIFPALVGSSLCTIAIFIPFMFLGGVTGAFFRVLALAMTLMLATSLLLCVTVLPRLGERQGAARAPSAAPRGASWTERAMRYGTRHRWVAVAAPLVLLAAIPLIVHNVGSGFLPEMDEGSLIMDYVTLPGSSVTETDRQLRQVEAGFDSIAAIATWSRRTGDQLGFFITESNRGDYVLRLVNGRRPPADDVADALRHAVERTQPTLEVEFGQIVEDVIGDLTTSPQPIEVRIFGEDRRVLEERAQVAAALLEKIRGVVDVKSGVVVSGPNLSIVPGPAAQRLGLGAEDLARGVAPYLQGIEAGQIPRGQRSWPVRVRLPMPAGAGTDMVREARVPVAHGRWTRLGDLADVRIAPGETEIARDDQRTMVAVTARLSGRDLGSAMAEIRRRMARDLPLGPGMSVQYAGLWAEQQSSFRGLAGVLIGATLAVLLVLLVSFRSWAHAAVVIVVAGASLAGVFLALLATRVTLNITSFVGAIMMVGIVAENAYFVVREHRLGLAAGLTPADAAAAAARRRARPVLMTTAAGVAALAPLALGMGSGSALLRPLAIAVVGGFALSALLILMMLPALLVACGDGGVERAAGADA